MLPAVRWKLMNLERLASKNVAKFETQLAQLDACLG